MFEKKRNQISIYDSRLGFQTDFSCTDIAFELIYQITRRTTV
jgi:hypothetical protein